MSKMKNAFANKDAFAAFITCGDPDLETTAAAVRAAAENGADLIELGIPFSDPTAESSVIQRSNLRALAGGTSTDRIFAFVKELRQEVTVPMVFMAYANVVFSYGAERFISACRDAGVGGLILPDLPFEEKEEFLPFCRKYGVDLVSVIAPAPEKRIAEIARNAEGFLYLVSGPGAAGGERRIASQFADMVKTVRANTDVPCAIEADLSAPWQAKNMAGISDGIIAGSAMVELLEQHGKEAPRYIGEYVKSVKDALR